MKTPAKTSVMLRCFSGALQFDAVLHREDGSYWGEVPDLPGCFSAGDTRAEVEADTVRAVELHVFGLLKRRAEEEAARTRSRSRRRTAGFAVGSAPRETVLA